jgi:hypothetical protein
MRTSKSNSEFQSLTSSPTQSPGPPQIQIDVHDTYEIGFGRSTYAQKEDEIELPMKLVPCLTKLYSTRIAETISISRVQLIQELSILKLMNRSHTTYNWRVRGVLGKLRR